MVQGLESEVTQLLNVINDTNPSGFKEVKLKWIPEEPEWNVLLQFIQNLRQLFTNLIEKIVNYPTNQSSISNYNIQKEM